MTTTTTTLTPVIGNDYWANFDSLVSGSGTELSPFTYNQIRNYFNSDLGDACNIIPASGDVINCEGIINLIASDTVFSIKININGGILIRVKDLNTKPWMVETVDNTYSEINLIKNEDGYGITNLEIRDFVICDNAVITTTTTTTTTTPAPVIPSKFAFGLDNGIDPKLYSSPDLWPWVAATLPDGTTRISYGNNILVATTDRFTPNGAVYCSINKGISWTQVVIPPVGTDPFYFYDIIVQNLKYVNDRFLALAVKVGLDTGYCAVIQSFDGITWTVSNIFDRWPIGYNFNFIYLNGTYCALGHLGDHGDPPTITDTCLKMTSDNVWTDNDFNLESVFPGTVLQISDETVSVGGGFVVAQSSYNGTGLRSGDGVTWEMLVESHMLSVYHIGSNFWATCDFGGGYILSVAYDDATLVQGAVVAGFLEGFKQIFDAITKVYALKTTEENKIYQSPIPPATPDWTTDSTGIPETVQLKQLLG